jgi:FAD/FMN-containing dehydrogenase
MSTTITNYDGSIVTVPQELVRPATVEELQAIMRQADRYPGPVRAMGSFHSLTPCASTSGTVVSMLGMNRILRIDPEKMTLTAQAGVKMVEAAVALREQNLQLILNIEIGNLTLGSAACCHTKDSLDGVHFGQVNSYITGIKWVSPSGTLESASEEESPELLSLFRGSYGLAGIVYEVTIKLKPLEIIKFDYQVHDVATLTQDQVSEAIASNESIVCWTVGRSVVIQTRNRATELRHEWMADSRRYAWSFLAAFNGRALSHNILAEDLESGMELGFFRLLGATGGFTLLNPDKMVDYSTTPQAARYAFTFWAFPRPDWVKNLQAYLDFAETYYKEHGFRCNMPLGSYFIRQDTSSLLSYSHDGDVISLDPIHAPGFSDTDKAAWASYLQAFNDWAHQRGGVPLLNQSPFVTKEHVVSAYGERWKKLSDWIRTADPKGRLLNPFFEELLA